MMLRLLAFLFVTMVAAAVWLLPGGRAQSGWSQGVDDVSLGRFAAWPTVASVDAVHYEDDVIKRVYPDHIERTYKSLERSWMLFFGATDHHNENPEDDGIPPFYIYPGRDDDVWPEEQNWVYKKFAVKRHGAAYGGKDGGTATAPNYLDRGDYTYTVSVNAIGPGTRIQTEHSMFYLKNSIHDFGYAAANYHNYGDGYVKGDFTVTDKYFTGSFLNENWVLLFDCQDNEYYSSVIPVLVSFSHRPDKIFLEGDYIRFVYWGSQTVERTFFLSLPFGVDGILPDSVFVGTDPWPNGLPPDVVERCRLVNRLVNNWPVDVEESFMEFTQAGTEYLMVRDNFTFSYMGGNWETGAHPVTNTPYALAPPVAGLAMETGFDVSLPYGTENLDLPTKNGPLYMQDNTAEMVYIIPAAPRHDVHLVGTPEETEWKQRTNRMVNQAAMRPGAYNYQAKFPSEINNRGETAVLAMTKQWTRDHYIDWMGQAVSKRVLNIYESSNYQGDHHLLAGWRKMTWDEIDPPPAGAWPEFWAYLYREPSVNPDYGVRTPFDIDAQMGMALEFLYEYGLWSGDWQTLSDHWNHVGGDFGPGSWMGITEIFDPLELFQDWATMAAFHDVWGGAGAEMDMFAAQLAGYDSYAKIAAALGNDAESKRARYLAAKAQIPFVTRWAAKPYMQQYYKTIDSEKQIVSGFGEWELSGALRGDAPRVVSQWADWTVAGERIHLLGYDILQSIPDTNNSFLCELDSFETTANQCLDTPGDHKSATFAQDKMYAFYRFGVVDKTRLNELIDLVYTDQESSPLSLAISGTKAYYKRYKVGYDQWFLAGEPVGTFDDSTLWQHRIFPLMTGVLEAYGVPIRIGAWAPARLTDAVYDPQTHDLTATFEMGNPVPGAPNPVVRFQADSEPSVQMTTGSSGTIAYDQFWGVKSVELTGNGPWTVVATIPPNPGVGWDTADPEDNLISDPGFEDCGFNPNYEMSWVPWDGTHVYDPGNFIGGQYARFVVHDVDDIAYLWQTVWVGPADDFADRHSIDFAFMYNIGCEEVVLDITIRQQSKEVMYRPSDGSSGPYSWLFKTSLTAEGSECGQWRTFSVEDLTLASEESGGGGDPASVIEVFFGLRHKDKWLPPEQQQWDPNGGPYVAYVDLVEVTCDDIDTSWEHGTYPIQQASAAANKLPVLSDVRVYPNPFNPETVVSFQTGQAGPVRLRIYDVTGALVKTLSDGKLPAGKHRFVWDASNSSGDPTASGIYFYKLEVLKTVVQGKLLLLK